MKLQQQKLICLQMDHKTNNMFEQSYIIFDYFIEMISERLIERFNSDEEEEQIKYSKTYKDLEIILQDKQDDEKERFLDPPLEVPKRSYSLEPDMANGWKPKKNVKANLNNVFSINYDHCVVDEIVKELYKNKKKYKQTLVYLGPRKNNSYILHEDRHYDNPYPVDKKLDQLFSARIGLPQNPKLPDCFLKFNSDFQSGNLDVAIQTSSNQFDLFMRVDTNTRGHTNWYNFSIQNGDFIGTIKFNICNFRRQKSLYQRGLKPYVCSKLQDKQWEQDGKNVRYYQSKLRYNFLYEEEYEFQNILSTFFTMSFQYDFTFVNDTVQLAYCVPYTYTRLIKFLSTLSNIKILPSNKSLSGLPIPILCITNQEEQEYNKKVVLITARIHPGESNSSFVAEGALEYLTSKETISRQIRKNYIIYFIPMLNPDGVIAGNYRTSFFGKDLNRTFDQSRKYAFPQTFHLVQFAKQLKNKHKKRFCLYLDLHGHSVKKNVFMYGPDYNIQQSNYENSRELPRLLSNITSYFRFYSCIFRITSEKTTTGRAIFNKVINVPFTYTMESSNGFYYDSVKHMEVPFTTIKWKQMGGFLCKGLYMLKLDEKNRPKILPIKKTKEEEYQDDLAQNKVSDDQISEGKSDSEPEEQDLSQKQLELIQSKIQGKIEQFSEDNTSPIRDINQKYSANNVAISKTKKVERPNVFFPPINSLNRAHIFSTRHNKKQMFKQQRLKNIEAKFECIEKHPKHPRSGINQLVSFDSREDVKNSMEVSKESRYEFLQKFRFSK